MTEAEIIDLLKQGTKIRTVANMSGICKTYIERIKAREKIKVKVPRGKDESKFFINGAGKKDYKSKYKQFRDDSEYFGF